MKRRARFILGAGFALAAFGSSQLAGADDTPSSKPPTPAVGARATPPPDALGAPKPPAGMAARGLSLREALSLLKSQSLALRSAALNVEAARADVIAAGVLNNPNLSVNGSFFVSGEPTGAKQSLNIIVDDVIPIAGQIGLRQDVAHLYVTAAERDLAATTWSLGSDVRDAYLALQLAQARLELSQWAEGDLDRVEEVVRKRAKEGANAPYDLVRVKVERSDLIAQTATAEAQVVEARIGLGLAIGKGIDPKNLFASDPLPEVKAPSQKLVDLTERAIARRPDIAAARARVDAASAHIKQAKREYVPSPDFAVGVSPWFNVPTATGERGGLAIYAGVGVPLPMFDHGQGKVDRAKIESQQASAQLDITARGVELAVDKAALELDSKVKGWTHYQTVSGVELDSLRSMADSSYLEGKTGILELLDAYRAGLAARGTELDLRGAALSAALDLERALGEGR